MSDLEKFFIRCDRLASHANLSLSTISVKLFNDGSRIKNLRLGKDVGIRRFGKAVEALAELEHQYNIPPMLVDVSACAAEQAPSIVPTAKPDAVDGAANLPCDVNTMADTSHMQQGHDTRNAMANSGLSVGEVEVVP